MSEQTRHLLVLLLIGIAGGCLLLGLAAYEKELSRKQPNENRQAAIIYTTGSWMFIILAVAIGLHAFALCVEAT